MLRKTSSLDKLYGKFAAKSMLLGAAATESRRDGREVEYRNGDHFKTFFGF